MLRYGWWPRFLLICVALASLALPGHVVEAANSISEPANCHGLTQVPPSQRPLLLIHGILSNSEGAFGLSALRPNDLKDLFLRDVISPGVANALTNGSWDHSRDYIATSYANRLTPHSMAWYLVKCMGYTPGKNLFAFNYSYFDHWEIGAAFLTAELRKLYHDGITDIDIVAHSQGGLVAKTWADSSLSRQSNQPRLHHLITLASPLLGSPVERIVQNMGIRGKIGAPLQGVLNTADRWDCAAVDCYQLVNSVHQQLWGQDWPHSSSVFRNLSEYRLPNSLDDKQSFQFQVFPDRSNRRWYRHVAVSGLPHQGTPTIDSASIYTWDDRATAAFLTQNDDGSVTGASGLGLRYTPDGSLDVDRSLSIDRRILLPGLDHTQIHDDAGVVKLISDEVRSPVFLVVVDGKRADLPIVPEMVDNRLFIPVRAAGALGATFTYDTSTQTAIVRLGTKELKATVGSRTLVVNGVAQAFDTAPYSRNGRVMVPIRPMAEAFGWKVRYVPEAESVALLTNPYSGAAQLGKFFRSFWDMVKSGDKRSLEYLTMNNDVGPRVWRGNSQSTLDDLIRWGQYQNWQMSSQEWYASSEQMPIPSSEYRGIDIVWVYADHERTQYLMTLITTVPELTGGERRILQINYDKMAFDPD